MKRLWIVIFCMLGACTQKTGSEAEPQVPLTAQELMVRGKATYVSNCISCHHIEPQKDGPLGPAVSGSTLELLEARILRAGYPPGYKPKRETAQMPALPHLEKEVPALYAFLNGK